MTASSAGSARLHVAVTGASGLIGSAVSRRLEAGGHRVSRLVRRPAGPGEISWDPAAGSLNPARLEGADAVIHLSGENVGARWTAARKARIRSSRVASTRLLS
jgi:NAD dependent epimerase/dehydratase family enzyme